MWPDRELHRELHQHQHRFRFSFHSARFGLLNIYCVCAEFPLQFVLGFLLYFGFFMATPPPPPPPSPAAHSRLLILNPKPFTHQQLGTLLSPLHLMCPMCVCVSPLALSRPSAPHLPHHLPSSPVTQKSEGRQITAIGRGHIWWNWAQVLCLDEHIELSHAR